MRIMAIDLGDARTGLAVSDAMGILCGEAWTMEEWDMERAAKRIAEAAKERGVERLVLGLPKNMDGSEGVRAEQGIIAGCSGGTFENLTMTAGANTTVQTLRNYNVYSCDIDGDGLIEYECPHCGTVIFFDENAFDMEEEHLCPNCHRKVFEDDGEDDEE